MQFSMKPIFLLAICVLAGFQIAFAVPEPDFTAAATMMGPDGKQDSDDPKKVESGKVKLTSAAPMNPDEDDELLDLYLNQEIGSQTKETGGLVDFENLKFFLYTPKENSYAQLVHFLNPISLNRTHWDPNRPTKIFIHGYAESGQDFVKNIKTAYFEIPKEKQSNLIIVDWGQYAHTYEYFYTAKYIVPMIGIAVGKLVKMLLNHVLDPNSRGVEGDHFEIDTKNTDRKNIHLIGHSLGSQVASDASRYLDVKVGRITGLDPASAYYQGLYSCPHISKNDADFVDIIHTNGHMFGYGMHAKVGHVDFYPNGGCFQEGCPVFANLDNHERSVSYFAESITADDFKAFWGRKAESWSKYKRGIFLSDEQLIMGENLVPDVTKEGSYFLRTNRFPPYAKGKK